MASGAGVAQGKTLLREEEQPEALPLEEQIRLRAHELWLRRAPQDGSAIEDWLQAEEELLRERES